MTPIADILPNLEITMAYTYKQQESIGDIGQSLVFSHLEKTHLVTACNYHDKNDRHNEQRGIDLICFDRTNGSQLTVQVKSDTIALKTQNAFVELSSVIEDAVPGWAYTCEADEIWYVVLDPNAEKQEAIVVTPEMVRSNLNQWKSVYRPKEVPNRRQNGTIYHTLGVLVPLRELRRISESIVQL